MNAFITVLAAFIPSLVLVYHFYKKDKRKPEPLKRIFKLFILGMVVVAIVLIPELILGAIFKVYNLHSVINAFLRAFIVAAVCEEIAKLLIVKKFIYNDHHFDEIMDGILYTVVVSLGFACVENIIYITGYGIEVITLRALFAVPLHASASGIMGYFIGKAKFSQSKIEEKNYMVKGLCFAITIHGLYNFIFFTLSGPLALLLNGIILFSAFRFLYNKINSAILEDEINEENSNSE